MKFELKGGFGAEGTIDPDIHCSICGHKGLRIKKVCRPRKSKDGRIRVTTWYTCDECGFKSFVDRVVA